MRKRQASTVGRCAHKVVETREEWCEEDRTGAVEPGHLPKVQTLHSHANATLTAKEKQTAN